MKKILLLSILALCLNASSVSAQSTKTIKLNDGTILKGQVIGMSEGIYYIKTADLGQVKIPESKIVSITAARTQNNLQNSPGAAGGGGDLLSAMGLLGGGATGGAGTAGMGGMNAQLLNQVQSLQGQILADPNVMLEIQKIMENPEIMSILSDQNILNAILSGDQTQMQSNEKIQRLMNDPQMKALIQNISNSLGTPQQ